MVTKVGDVFNYPGTGPDLLYGRSGWHIHMVVKIDESGGDAYLLPLSSSPIWWDSTCEIDVTDGCPFVTKRCFVSYAEAKKVSINGMEQTATPGGPAPPELLARAIAGIRKSSKTPQWFKDAVCPVARQGRIHRSA